MKICIVSDTFIAGGAEWFTLRLAESLQKQNNTVKIFVLRSDLVVKSIVKQFPTITIIGLPAWLTRIIFFIDRGQKQFSGRYLLLDWANSIFLRQQFKKFKPDVIHSHLLNVDVVVVRANSKLQARHVVTIHGDYIEFIKRKDERKIKLSLAVLNKVDGIVIISEEQRELLSSTFPFHQKKIEKIYNGYPEPVTDKFKKERGTHVAAFNFGLIARGIPEKGWEPSIKAFLLLNRSETKLLLWGEGEHINKLKERYSDGRIEFRGFTNAPLQAIAELDCGLFPSYYPSESLPTTIIEYLLMKKPIIATAVGEIPRMMKAGKELAGILLSTVDPHKTVPGLKTAMESMLDDKFQYNRYKQIAGEAFKKFTMDECVQAYMKVYKK